MFKINLFILFFAATVMSSDSKLVLTGSSTIAPLMSEIAKAFEAKNPGMRVDVQSGGSSRGVTDTRDGTADIGMVSRDLKDDESDLKSFPIAKDGIAIILHKTNPVNLLTKQQIVDIYLGKITNWRQVGASDAPITVVNKAEGRSTLELFCHYFGMKNTEIKSQIIIGDNEQGVKTVAGNKNAIGYVSIGTAEYDLGHGTAIKLLPMDGVAATVNSVRLGRFPISRNLNLVTKIEPKGLQKKLIDFARSPEVVEIVKKQYMVPITQ